MDRVYVALANGADGELVIHAGNKTERAFSYVTNPYQGYHTDILEELPHIEKVYLQLWVEGEQAFEVTFDSDEYIKPIAEVVTQPERYLASNRNVDWNTAVAKSITELAELIK